jgi:hypothetical protein
MLFDVFMAFSISLAVVTCGLVAEFWRNLLRLCPSVAVLRMHYVVQLV